MHNDTYQKLLAFKRRNRGTICWRLKAHAKVIDKHLNPDEEIQYIFAAQKGLSSLDFFNTYVVAVTNKRLLLAQKRVLFGYMFLAVTPDMFNDLTVRKGIIFGNATIDTIKEKVVLSNIDPKALPEIETIITEYMMTEKKKYNLLGEKR